MNKKQARIISQNYRDNIDEKLRKIYSKIIVQKIEKDKIYQESRLIGIYHPIKNEVDISNLKHKYAKFAYPRINCDKIEFIEVVKQTKWRLSNFNILEPIKGNIVNDKIDLLLIPALARNFKNYRLGYGKGYYDKFIKKYNPKNKIGILFDDYKLDFNEDLWDIALDYYITNKEEK